MVQSTSGESLTIVVRPNPSIWIKLAFAFFAIEVAYLVFQKFWSVPNLAFATIFLSVVLPFFIFVVYAMTFGELCLTFSPAGFQINDKETRPWSKLTEYSGEYPLLCLFTNVMMCGTPFTYRYLVNNKSDFKQATEFISKYLPKKYNSQDLRMMPQADFVGYRVQQAGLWSSIGLLIGTLVLASFNLGSQFNLLSTILSLAPPVFMVLAVWEYFSLSKTKEKAGSQQPKGA